MYQQLSNFDFVALVVVSGLVLLVATATLLIVGVQQKEPRFILGGVASGILMVLICGLGFSPAKAQQDSHLSAMENNILQKYNTKFHPDYLTDVDFYDDEGRGKSGDYFIVTYDDLSTEKVLFRFNSETGEPSCDCSLEE